MRQIIRIFTDPSITIRIRNTYGNRGAGCFTDREYGIWRAEFEGKSSEYLWNKGIGRCGEYGIRRVNLRANHRNTYGNRGLGNFGGEEHTIWRGEFEGKS